MTSKIDGEQYCVMFEVERHKKTKRSHQGGYMQVQHGTAKGVERVRFPC